LFSQLISLNTLVIDITTFSTQHRFEMGNSAIHDTFSTLPGVPDKKSTLMEIPVIVKSSLFHDKNSTLIAIPVGF
jgi:hypothetical protein